MKIGVELIDLKIYVKVQVCDCKGKKICKLNLWFYHELEYEFSCVNNNV